MRRNAFYLGNRTKGIDEATIFLDKEQKEPMKRDQFTSKKQSKTTIKKTRKKNEKLIDEVPRTTTLHQFYLHLLRTSCCESEMPPIS